MCCIRVDSCCCGCTVRFGATCLAATYAAFGVFAFVSGTVQINPVMIAGPLVVIVMNILLLVGIK